MERRGGSMTEHEKRLIICALQDYALKCDYFINKSPMFADLYTNYQRTTNKLIKELKS